MYFLVAPVFGSSPPLPAVPPAVKRAGGKTLREFKTGRLVYAQSGCAACHRIGTMGNARPGPNLTHVGARLPSAAIMRAILHPTAPMPSFKGLPHAKLEAIVEFLSLLR
jgi:menaquinol-cytochrome c reductase cytochrome b/c subunit